MLGWGRGGLVDSIIESYGDQIMNFTQVVSCNIHVVNFLCNALREPFSLPLLP